MKKYTGEEIKRYEAVISEVVAYGDQPTAPMFADVLGAIRYLDDVVKVDNERIKEQAREIMDLHARLFNLDLPDPLGRGAIVELVDRYPLPSGDYFPGGLTGVVDESRVLYEGGEHVGVKFPGFMDVYKVSTIMLRVIRAAHHAR